VGADGADGCAPGFSGAAVRRMVRAGPSRRVTSMPTMRRKVAARRSRPARARGAFGQLLLFRCVPPTCSARPPRSSGAVPVHSVRVVIQRDPAGCCKMRRPRLLATFRSPTRSRLRVNPQATGGDLMIGRAGPFWSAYDRTGAGSE